MKIEHLPMDEENKEGTKRKTLAVDEETYDLLQRICLHNRRSKIDTLRIMIENEYDYTFRVRDEDMH